MNFPIEHLQCIIDYLPHNTHAERIKSFSVIQYLSNLFQHVLLIPFPIAQTTFLLATSRHDISLAHHIIKNRAEKNRKFLEEHHIQICVKNAFEANSTDLLNLVEQIADRSIVFDDISSIKDYYVFQNMDGKMATWWVNHGMKFNVSYATFCMEFHQRFDDQMAQLIELYCDADFFQTLNLDQTDPDIICSFTSQLIKNLPEESHAAIHCLQIIDDMNQITKQLVSQLPSASHINLYAQRYSLQDWIIFLKAHTHTYRFSNEFYICLLDRINIETDSPNLLIDMSLLEHIIVHKFSLRNSAIHILFDKISSKNKYFDFITIIINLFKKHSNISIDWFETFIILFDRFPVADEKLVVYIKYTLNMLEPILFDNNYELVADKNYQLWLECLTTLTSRCQVRQYEWGNIFCYIINHLAKLEKALDHHFSEMIIQWSDCLMISLQQLEKTPAKLGTKFRDDAKKSVDTVVSWLSSASSYQTFCKRLQSITPKMFTVLLNIKPLISLKTIWSHYWMDYGEYNEHNKSRNNMLLNYIPFLKPFEEEELLHVHSKFLEVFLMNM